MIDASPGRRRNLEATLAVTLLVLAALACSSVRSGPSGNTYERQLTQNDAALEKLVFGMSRSEVAAVMGTTPIVPPWANVRGIGPQILGNPLDTLEFEAPGGDHYEVRRYAVELSGDYRCPFIRGEAELVPLIFFENRLVGWRWSYLASALQRRLTTDEQTWSFGEFCGSATKP